MIVGFWDLECSNLRADFGQILCGVVGRYNSDDPARPGLSTFGLTNFKKDRWNDRALAVAIRDHIETYDLIVTYNGSKFDLPFLNTRLAEYGERGAELRRHKDLLYTMRHKFRLHSNRLDNAASFMGLPVQKTKLDWLNWRKALCGDERAYSYIIDHCEKDVQVLCLLWDRVKTVAGALK